MRFSNIDTFFKLSGNLRCVIMKNNIIEVYSNGIEGSKNGIFIFIHIYLNFLIFITK